MALIKQPVAINFQKGLNTKADAYQVPVGQFLALNNSVFTKTGRLTKRNGFSNITKLPVTDQTTITTLNGNLITTGSSLYAYSQDTDQWLNQGIVQPVQLDTLSLLRASTSQTSPDLAISPAGLACLVYMDGGQAYYQVSDSVTGQQIVSRQALPSSAKYPRVFILGPYFVITFTDTVAAAPHLQYLPISLASPASAGTIADISSNLSSIDTGYDGYVANDTLYLSWGGSASSVKIAFLTSSLVVSPTVQAGTGAADLVSVTVDTTNNRVWTTWYSDSANDVHTAAFDYQINPVLASTSVATSVTLAEITSVIETGVLNIFYEVSNTYGYSPNARTDYVSTATVTSGGTVVGPSVVVRSVGLASKAFLASNGTIYMLVEYGYTGDATAAKNSNQPSYFLIDSAGNIYMRLAYSNGGGYAKTQVLPAVSVQSSEYCIPYLITDFLTTTNKGTNLPSGTPVNAIYTQTGVNVAKFSLNTTQQYSSEIASALHLTGGQLWEYDGIKPAEHGFQVWPEQVAGTTATTGGSITAGTYYYQFTYEWTDNQGNLHRSAPSIPVVLTTTGSTSTNTLNVPTLRLTYKTSPNPVRIVGYRWSVAQQVYYQFTSVTSPTLNDPTTDSVTVTDTLEDSAILGNAILYTTGGVIENIAAPASVASALFNNRLFLIDAEDRNLLWFSKQVIESTPVEMSDLLTLYVAPTTGAQGSTGDMTALSAMDDKLIIFKKDAIYYITGSGPDNTGANSTFSDPVFITATVGCANPRSIVLMPNGLMFQSDKGIWLLGRDLSTAYIGDRVEQYNDYEVLSAVAIPATNQVRFILNNNVTLMYDYYFNEWSTHTNVSAISSTLYEGEHTYLNLNALIFQETPGMYTDGSVPVLMSLTTSWINIAGLQGFERFYFANLLGTYYTPFKLNVTLAYDYNPSATQAILVTPDNYGGTWGSEAVWGSGGPWGGSEGNVFTARLFPTHQKCQSFQVTIQELYDSSLGVAPGQGLTLSGLALITGVKRGFRTQSAKKSFG